ncbi:MAG: hypothetical protein ACRD4A_04960, partial [Candidatus Acidiferrales bacterium]
WNREAAVRKLTRVTWLLPALIVVFDLIGIVGLGFVKHNWSGAILFATLPTLLLGFVYAGAKQGLTKLRMPQAAGAKSGGEAASFATAANLSVSKEKSEQYDFLVSLPPPRPVRLRSRGKIMLTVVLLVVFVLDGFLIWNLYGLWYGAHSFADFRGPQIFLACLAVLIACVPFFVRRGIVRHKNLMQSGAVAMARVTGQRTLKGNSIITYEFEDANGKTISESVPDLTRSLYEGMAVPVFYDAQNPKRQVAACASFFEIVNPSDE